MTKFNPNIYKGKKTITVKIPHLQGVRLIYDWNESKSKYVKRNTGNRYSATLKVNGKQREQFFPSLKEAKEWRISGGSMFSDTKSELTFDELTRQYFENVKSRINPSTLQTYKNNAIHLKHLADIKVSKIDHRTIDKWLVFVKSAEYSVKLKSTKLSFEKEIALLGQIFNFYIDYIDEAFISPIKRKHKRDCIIDHNRFREAKSKSKQKFLTDTEMRLLFKTLNAGLISDDKKKRLLSALAWFQLRTGTRIGEAAAVHYRDLNFQAERPYVHIGRSVQWKRGKDAITYIQNFTKTGEARSVLLPDDIISILMNQRNNDLSGLTDMDIADRLVFSTDGINPFSYRAIQYHFNRCYQSIGTKWRSTHILRHSFSTQYLSITRDRHALSKTLGHANLRQTEHYAKITDSLVEESFESYQNALNTESQKSLKMVQAGILENETI